MRKEKKCDICGKIVKGNNIYNHRISHKPPQLKCTLCDYIAYFPSQIDNHHQRKHLNIVAQGRPRRPPVAALKRNKQALSRVGETSSNQIIRYHFKHFYPMIVSSAWHSWHFVSNYRKSKPSSELVVKYEVEPKVYSAHERRKGDEEEEEEVLTDSDRSDDETDEASGSPCSSGASKDLTDGYMVDYGNRIYN